MSTEETTAKAKKESTTEYVAITMDDVRHPAMMHEHNIDAEDMSEVINNYCQKFDKLFDQYVQKPTPAQEAKVRKADDDICDAIEQWVDDKKAEEAAELLAKEEEAAAEKKRIDDVAAAAKLDAEKKEAKQKADAAKKAEEEEAAKEAAKSPVERKRDSIQAKKTENKKKGNAGAIAVGVAFIGTLLFAGFKLFTKK